MSGPTARGAAAAGRPPAPPRLAVRVRRVEGPAVVAVRVWLRGGGRLEDPPGLALVAGRGLAEGTRRRSWRQVAEAADDRGMGLSAFGGDSCHGLALDALAADLDRALEWAAEMTLEPAFPEDRVAWLRRQAAAELESLADHPDSVAGWAFERQLYDPHPRSRPPQGTVEGLARVTPDTCAEFHRRALGWGMVVTAAGAVDEAAVEERVRRLFPGAGQVAEPMPAPPTPRGLATARQEVAAGGEEQCHLLAGHLTVTRCDPDHPALELAGVVLGAGAGLRGRIPERIREREGLAYAAHAETVAGAGLDPGHLAVYVGTSRRHLARAERALREELARLCEEGLRAEEIEEARSYLLGREPFGRETARQWADLLGRAELLGLPLDRPDYKREALARLDGPAVAAAIRRHVDPGCLKVTVGMPEAGSARKALSRTGR